MSRDPTFKDSERFEQAALNEERRNLVNGARELMLSLHRTCVHSARVTRHGNEHDEKEFQERQRKRLERDIETDVRLGMLSMLPPVDREDELRSRCEHYLQHARENFMQEPDCLVHDEWSEQHIYRYLHHLRRGEEHRKWLLRDMKFEDPCRDSFDNERVERLEKRAISYISKLSELKLEELSPEVKECYLSHQKDNRELLDGNRDDDDGFWDDDDERMKQGHSLVGTRTHVAEASLCDRDNFPTIMLNCNVTAESWRTIKCKNQQHTRESVYRVDAIVYNRNLGPADERNY